MYKKLRDLPAPQGLYDPAYEHDSCGIGLVVNIKGNRSYNIIDDALTILENLKHRGAEGADAKSGDGAGILVQIPHQFFVRECEVLGISLPAAGDYGVGMIFPIAMKGSERNRWPILNGLSGKKAYPFWAGATFLSMKALLAAWQNDLPSFSPGLH